MIRAGRLSDRIEFEAKVETTNTGGQIVSTWVAAFFEWAEAIRSSETSATFTIRYRQGITPASHRVLWDSCIWLIVSAVHDVRRTTLTISSDFSSLIEVTHLGSVVHEYIEALPVLRPREE